MNKRLYNIWGRMKQRCGNLIFPQYKDYGGRGIKVCNEWLEFIPFRDWSLNNGYADNLEIDRIDNNLGYSPENCQWITHKENTQNRKTTKLNKEKVIKIREKYETKNFTLKQLAEEYNMHRSVIFYVIKKKTWANV